MIKYVLVMNLGSGENYKVEEAVSLKGIDVYNFYMLC